MYFWSLDKLKKDLQQGDLPEKESLKYLLAYIISTSIALVSLCLMNGKHNIWDIYEAILGTIVSIWGVTHVYQCNSGANGKNFLQRFFSLGWVTLIRFTVIIELPALLIVGIPLYIYLGSPKNTTLPEVIFVQILGAYYYLQLGQQMKSLTESNNRSD